ncbi:MAG: rod shape-determining protein MreD [Muribaculaceae bacterium]|nr:rod shape-determining protein MreD [Muribaculaceae bacterium]
MNQFAIRFTIAYLLLIPLQALVFDHMVLFNVAVPFVFIYLIVMLPVTLGTNVSVVLGFLAGLGMDMFADTPGMNSLSCTILAFARKPLFHLYTTMDDDLAGRSPSAQTMGSASFLKYVLTLSLCYSVLVFTIEAFQLFIPELLLTRIVASTLYTFLLIYTLDSLLIRRREKRL